MKFNDYQPTNSLDGTEMILVRKWNPTKGPTGSFDTFKTFISTVTSNVASSILSQVESLSSQFSSYVSTTNATLQTINASLASILADQADTTTPTVLKLSGTLTTPTLAIGRNSITVTVTGVQVGDAIAVTLGTALPSGVSIAAWRVTAADKIAVDLSASLVISTTTNIPVSVIVVR